jgi:hypothetical protein
LEHYEILAFSLSIIIFIVSVMPSCIISGSIVPAHRIKIFLILLTIKPAFLPHECPPRYFPIS